MKTAAPSAIAHSYSRFSAYVQCPKAYAFEYLEKLEKRVTEPLLLGGAAHDFFEAYDRHLMAAKLTTDHARAEKIMGEVWKKFERPLNPNLYDEFIGICREHVQHHVLNLQTIVSVEEQIAFDRELRLVDWYAKNVWLRVKLDRLDQLKGEGGRTVIRVTDYKTGWGGDADPFQLKMYAFGVLMRNRQRGIPDPDLFETVIRYTRSGFEDKYAWSVEDVELTREKVELLAARIEGELKWRPTPGSACSSCPFAHVCPAKASHLLTIANESEAAQVANDTLLLEAQLRGKKEALEAWVHDHGAVEARGVQFLFGTRESYKVLDPLQFVEGLKEAGYDPTEFYKVDSTGLKKKCQKDPQLADRIADAVHVQVKTIFTHKTMPKKELFEKSQGETAHDETQEAGAAAARPGRPAGKKAVGRAAAGGDRTGRAAREGAGADRRAEGTAGSPGGRRGGTARRPGGEGPGLGESPAGPKRRGHGGGQRFAF